MTTVPADNFVETLRVNVGNKDLTDNGFRDFVRKTLEIVDNGIIYTAKYELGVHGMHTRFETLSGNFDQIKSQLRRVRGTFFNELMSADDEDGDLRRYAPQFANGYPSLDGYEPEEGTDYDVSLIELREKDTDEELHYFHALCVDLRENGGSVA